jgi:hypothetical protein
MTTTAAIVVVVVVVVMVVLRRCKKIKNQTHLRYSLLHR